MDIIRQDGAKILITTPDYPPRLGGLSTFTIQIEKILKKMNIAYDLYVWQDVGHLKSDSKKLGSYDTVFHIQCIGGFFMSYKAKKVINFVHGSEILFHSPNIIKRLIKLFLKQKIFSFMNKATFNIFISEFTREAIVKKGYELSFSRDIVIHNCIDTSNSFQCINDIDEDEWRFICVARDVPHKNIEATRNLCHMAFKHTGKNIKLYVTCELAPIAGVEIINIAGASNEELDRYYQSCHFNLLLSLDHRHRGFFEGFGLTILEAGLYGTPSIVSSFGGQAEAVHDKETGWVLEAVDSYALNSFWQKFDKEKYKTMSNNVLVHTNKIHGLDHYQKIIERCLL